MEKIKELIIKIVYHSLVTVGTLAVILTAASMILWSLKTPSNDRDWEFGQQKAQQVEIKGDKITVKDLRDYNWTNEGNEEKYHDFSFILGDIQSMEIGESHFSVHEGIGHIFLIFNLKDGRDIALSIESRRDNGEDFTIPKGLMFDYELIYLLATKKDLISLREKRNERIYLYPIKASAAKSQELFLLIADRVNSLYETPEFYHLFFANCTNLITKEVEKISDKKFPFYEKTFAPGHAGRALFEMGIIDSDIDDFNQLQAAHLVKF